MKSGQVVDLLQLFATAGVRVWLAGGWAVDALAGRQTREHGDMDVAVHGGDLRRLLDLLHQHHFVVTADWAPSRLEVTSPDGRVVDIHPVTFAEDGTGYQAGHQGEGFFYASDGFATGTIDGSTVPCLSAQQQLSFRTGYEPRAVDLHDIRLLEQFGERSSTAQRTSAAVRGGL